MGKIYAAFHRQMEHLYIDEIFSNKKLQKFLFNNTSSIFIYKSLHIINEKHHKPSVRKKNCKIARQEIVTIKCLDLNKSKKNYAKHPNAGNLVNE